MSPFSRGTIIAALLWVVLLLVQGSWLHDNDHITHADLHCSTCINLLQWGQGLSSSVSLPVTIKQLAPATQYIALPTLTLKLAFVHNRGPPL